MLRGSHRRRRRGIRLVLLLAISVCLASIIDFGYIAYQKTVFFTTATNPRSNSDSEYGNTPIMDLDLHMQLDAAVALLASAVLLGTSVKLSKIPHRRKRLVLGVEGFAVTLMVVASLLWNLTLWELPAELKKKPEESKDERQAAWYETMPHAEWPTDMTIAGDKSPTRR
jgi:hypothetical protein